MPKLGWFRGSSPMEDRKFQRAIPPLGIPAINEFLNNTCRLDRGSAQRLPFGGQHLRLRRFSSLFSRGSNRSERKVVVFGFVAISARLVSRPNCRPSSARRDLHFRAKSGSPQKRDSFARPFGGRRMDSRLGISDRGFETAATQYPGLLRHRNQ